MMEKILDVYTAGAHYKVNRAGWIERVHPHVLPSPQWRLLGIILFNNFGHGLEGRMCDDLFAGLIPEKLRFKNGKPSWRLHWFDHGLNTVSMNDAIINITLREVIEGNGGT